MCSGPPAPAPLSPPGSGRTAKGRVGRERGRAPGCGESRGRDGAGGRHRDRGRQGNVPAAAGRGADRDAGALPGVRRVLEAVTSARSAIFADEHEAFRDTVRRFIAKEVTPSVEAWEE